MTQQTKITPSPYWTGKAHGTRYVCEFCANVYRTAYGLRWHLKDKHPDVEIK